MPVTKLYIDKEVEDYSNVREFSSRIDLEGEIVDDQQVIFDIIQESSDPIQKAKEVIFLTRNKGAFIKKCPGTSIYTCCGYKILHIGTFCDMDCSYCILQTYFHPPIMQYFVNHIDMMTELDRIFEEKAIHRVGTGEFTDSLIWEKWTDIASKLVTKFSKQNNSILELKSKTVNIKKLENLNHNGKTILAWSMNTPHVIKEEEKDTTPLKARLRAAQKVESWGYKLAFHFDPMVFYDNCHEEYKDVVRQIFKNVSPENVAYISIGSFRFMPDLKQIIQKRFKESTLVYGEFIHGLDNKMRYFKPLRLKMYQAIVSEIKLLAPDVLVYFCMEDDEIWEKTFGFVPDKDEGLSKMLDKRVAKLCGLNKGLLI
ncbi:MAG: DNA photolyase [Desulfobacterales bacterium]|nr:DNA photolyase [Desulfobacterales bacterium]MCP4161329.1 DNA photolyase [Deltaproteobacteria bacterium]